MLRIDKVTILFYEKNYHKILRRSMCDQLWETVLEVGNQNLKKQTLHDTGVKSFFEIFN